ncbi:hypothetical protein BC833DRAFT_567457 [Globomyces pollinis-pini]|nr:hypothetical protein BC833DRAFT_567457 [Globomyces pollinis-pini]
MHLCLLLYLGHEFPNIHRRLSNDEWFTELFNLIDHQDEKVESISIALLSELFPYDELSYAILESIPDNLLNRLCFLIHFNHYEDNGKSNAALTLLLKIHGQFIKKRGSIRTKVLDVLLHQSLLSHRKEISLSIIHHFNRSGKLLKIYRLDDTNVQNSTIDLLHTIIQRDAEYFYTNDINVLFDVTLREVMRINDSNEQLRHQYMKLLPKLIHSIPAGSPGACKTLKTQMKDKLTKISSSPLSTTSTCLLAQRILNEID